MRSRRVWGALAAAALVLLVTIGLVIGIRQAGGANPAPCPVVVDRTARAAVLDGLRCALARNDGPAWQALVSGDTVGWGGLGEADLPESQRRVPVTDLPRLLQKSRLPETACISNAYSEDGALWAVLTGPWEGVDWPGRFGLPLYKKHILFQFRQVQGEYVLEALLAGAPDCCGVGGQRPVEGAFYYPGIPFIRFQNEVALCSGE